MNKIFGAILVTATALAGTTAFAENAVAERSAELDRLLAQDRATERQVTTNEAGFAFFGLLPSLSRVDLGIADASKVEASSNWQGNFRAGRKFGTAGR
ncbi:MAG: hypothetical protein AAF713_04115 [Pseudomonadota bacterium]